MKIAVDVNALMFIISKYAIHHPYDVLHHEEFEKAEYSSYCIDTIMKAMEILRDEFYCVFYDTSNEANTKQYYDALFECTDLSISEVPTSLDVCAVGKYEEDITCAHICQSGEVDVVLSSHYDSLLFGCHYLIKDIDMVERYVDVMILQSIYNHFNIDHFQAIDIFILMDMDYNKKISRVGSKTALAKIQSHGKLENTKYYNKKELSINRLRQIYNCTYLKHKVRWFSIKANEEFDMLECSIKIL
uniref:XPG-I domain-containing protein n=1 Tax=Physcomitrium patens TaxID=3218 RepID=A0A2K1JLX6_PHYPA|nr:hypothetical protein PHYPA_017378 [Physcomitrium patens]